MTAASTSFATANSCRVVFSGAEVIEYDAELPSVVRFAGVGSVDTLQTTAKLALECQARGLEGSEEQQRQSLLLQYVDEARRALLWRGFQPVSDKLNELQQQLRVVELLLARVAGAGDQKTRNLLDMETLRRVQMNKKQLEGRVDDGYAFGRRFLAVSTYVDTLNREELLAVAQERDLQLPRLDDKQRAAVKAPDRELLGLHGSAAGRPLRVLTLRQLVTEAEARGMIRETARDNKGKKSKRAWVDVLRPVMVAEVRASKIMEQEEELIRQKVVQELEKEKEQEQKQRVVQLIEEMMKEIGDCTEPEDDESIQHEDQENDQKVDTTRKYLEVLVKTVCLSSEDVVMED